MPLTCCVPIVQRKKLRCSAFLVSAKSATSGIKPFYDRSRKLCACTRNILTTQMLFELIEFRITGQSVSLQRNKPKLCVSLIFWIFENLPVNPTKPKPQSHSHRENPPAKQRRVLLPLNIDQDSFI